jgi:uncharacterized protein YbdZ (MbtH family)
MIAKQIFFCRNNILNANLFVRNLNHRKIYSMVPHRSEIPALFSTINQAGSRKPCVDSKEMQKYGYCRNTGRRYFHREVFCRKGISLRKHHSAGKEVR